MSPAFPSKPPTRPGGALADYITALFCTIGVMFALHHTATTSAASARRSTSRSTRASSGSAARSRPTTCSAPCRCVRQRETRRSRRPRPSRTRDGHWVAINGGTDNVWRRLLKRMGREDLASDARFATARERARHHAEVNAIVGALGRVAGRGGAARCARARRGAGHAREQHRRRGRRSARARARQRRAGGARVRARVPHDRRRAEAVPTRRARSTSSRRRSARTTRRSGAVWSGWPRASSRGCGRGRRLSPAPSRRVARFARTGRYSGKRSRSAARSACRCAARRRSCAAPRGA